MANGSSAASRPATIRGPDFNTRSPRVNFPAGACDCHAHVFGPQDRFPYLPNATYIPPDALVEWLPDVPARVKVLVENPAHLYDFH